MDCLTATKVYSSNNPLSKIQELFPEAWSFFTTESKNLIKKEANSFDSQVKEIVGQTDFDYRVVHRDDKDTLTMQIQELLGDITSRLLIQDYFSKQIGQNIYFNTVCCSGHISSRKDLNLEESLKIQKAAISIHNIEADLIVQ